jgi:hypothetical protein
MLFQIVVYSAFIRKIYYDLFKQAIGKYRFQKHCTHNGLLFYFSDWYIIIVFVNWTQFYCNNENFTKVINVFVFYVNFYFIFVTG